MLADRFLETYATESLKVMARRRGLHEAGTATKAELIEFLAPRLFSREANRRLVQSLPPKLRQLLGALKARGSRASTAALAAALGDDPADAGSCLRELVELGLVLYPAEGRPLKYRIGECERVWMDRTAADAVDPVACSGALPKLLVQAPEASREGQLGLFLADLFLFTLHVERRAFRPEPDETGENDWQALARNFLVPPDSSPAAQFAERGRLRFLYLLLTEAGLLNVKKGCLAPSERAGPFFHMPRSRQALRLFETFKRLRNWNEFRQIPELVPCPLRDRETHEHVPSPGRVVRARARVLASLRRFDPERWYAFSSLRREIQATHPQFLIRRGETSTAGHLYRGFGERGRNGAVHPLDLTTDWDHVEGRFIARLLLEPLLWLGAVSLGFPTEAKEEETQPDAFRITREGAYMLGLCDALPRSHAGRGPLVVQSDFDVLALDSDPDTGVLHDLSRFADFTGGDHVVRFTLTREAATRGFHDGWSPARITRRLGNGNRTPVPQNVVVSLAAWEEAWLRFRIVRGVSLLEDREGFFSTDTDFHPSRIGLQAVGPGLWRFGPGATTALPRFLRARGVEVRRFDYQARPGHGLVLGPGLRITRCTRGEDWVTEALLSRCAVPDRGEAGVWELDRKAVSMARDDGLTAENLLEMLEARSPAPSPEIRVALHAWGGKTEEVGLGRATFFVCHDSDLLRLILDTPALASCLQEPLGPGTLAVAHGRTGEFRRLLRELQVPVSGRLRPAPGPAPPGPRDGDRAEAGTLARRLRNSSSALAWPGEQSGAARLFTPGISLRELLQVAIEDGRRVRMAYRGGGRGPSEREVSPLRLTGQDLVAYCHQQAAPRTYRLERITALQVLSRPQ